ncbi:MAG: hypothetical protein NDI81_19120 [Desulfobacula sp.]|nr:hypothetical protein [Desulfobacula sp.]
MNNTRKSNEPDPSPHKTDAPSIGDDMADVGSMDKIRDILFGHQAKDYEKRFLKMENHLADLQKKKAPLI